MSYRGLFFRGVFFFQRVFGRFVFEGFRQIVWRDFSEDSLEDFLFFLILFFFFGLGLNRMLVDLLP